MSNDMVFCFYLLMWICKNIALLWGYFFEVVSGNLKKYLATLNTTAGLISCSGQHNMSSRRGFRGPGAIQDRVTHSLRRRGKSHVPDSSAVNPFVKYFLFGANFLFLLIGLAVLITGIYILAQKNKTVTSFVEFIFDPACDLCLGGSIVLVIAFFGCGGALRESILFLRIYYVLLTIFFLLEIVVIIFVFVFYFGDGTFASIGLYPKDAFKEAIIKYRDDPDMQDFIDSIQQLLSCCGTSNDDVGYLDWKLNPYFNCSKVHNSSEFCSVPYSCCKMHQWDQINYRCGADTLRPNSDKLGNINTQGCLKGLQSVITNNIWIVGGIILGVLLPQIFFICCANALISQIFEQISKWYTYSRC